MQAKCCFAPVLAPQVRVLVLGSLPGERSLAASQYYAHPQNQFWRLIGTVIGVDLPALPYAVRLDTLLAHHVGLWDVVAEAERAGSLDSGIRAHRVNDLRALVDTLPALRAVAFNGGTAARVGRRALGTADGLALVDLPSSSPAYTLDFAAKLARWQALAPWLGSAGRVATAPDRVAH